MKKCAKMASNISGEINLDEELEVLLFEDCKSGVREYFGYIIYTISPNEKPIQASYMINQTKGK